MRCFDRPMSVFILICLSCGAAVAGPEGSPPGRPGPHATPPEGQHVVVEMRFVERSGATLAERRIELTLGKTETVSIAKGSRTVSAETTVTRVGKAGCHHVDVTLRDGTIDASGRFNKTTWQSGSDPCGTDPITLGPKDETRLQIGVRTAS